MPGVARGILETLKTFEFKLFIFLYGFSAKMTFAFLADKNQCRNSQKNDDIFHIFKDTVVNFYLCMEGELKHNQSWELLWYIPRTPIIPWSGYSHWANLTFTLNLEILDILNFSVLSLVESKVSRLLIGCSFSTDDILPGISNEG